MKKILLLTLCCIMQYWVHAQAHFTIGSGTHFSVSNAASVVMDTGEFVNNGFYTLLFKIPIGYIKCVYKNRVS